MVLDLLLAFHQEASLDLEEAYQAVEVFLQVNLKDEAQQGFLEQALAAADRQLEAHLLAVVDQELAVHAVQQPQLVAALALQLVEPSSVAVWLVVRCTRYSP